MDRSTVPTRKRRLDDPEDHSEVRRLTPSARVALVWPLTLQAWAFHAGLRMNRDFVEMLSALRDAGADYLVVGAHALAAHRNKRAAGRPRDLADIAELEAEE